MTLSKRRNVAEQFDPPLEEDELTFYDLIAQNESAVDVLGGGVLAQIAREWSTP